MINNLKDSHGMTHDYLLLRVITSKERDCLQVILVVSSDPSISKLLPHVQPTEDCIRRMPMTLREQYLREK